MLREEQLDEKIDLESAQTLFQFVIQQRDGSGLEELMIGVNQLLGELKKLDNDQDYYEATIISILAKMMHQFGSLPPVDAGALIKDVFLTQQAVERLCEWKNEDAVQLYSLLQDSHRRKKRHKGNTDNRSWGVRWIALVARMACSVHDETVEWTKVESTVRQWLQGTFCSTEVTAGLALAALDILDSATCAQPTVGNVRVTGLTPRRVANMLNVPRYVMLP